MKSRTATEARPRASANWFEVDRQGLAQIVARRGKSFILAEVVSNSWDAPGTSTVAVTLEPAPGARPRGAEGLVETVLRVEDDAPDGFRDLAEAFTLFAPSSKKSDATKRGRFCLGEKLVLALATRATITSTRGAWEFTPEGRRPLRRRRERGSLLEIHLTLSAQDLVDCQSLAHRLIPPADIITSYNGTTIQPRPAAYSTEETLPTEISGPDGGLRPTARKTSVELIRLQDGEEQGWLYELGIPVVPIEGATQFSVVVGQKCPLNMDRDNVTPGFMRRISTIMLNLSHEELSSETANSSWAREALANQDASEEAVRSAFRARFGDKAVVFDPNDMEATHRAVSEGYTVVHGSQLSAGEWSNVRRAEAALPAGRVTPTARPYSPEGRPSRTIQREDWTPAMVGLASLSAVIARECAGVHQLQVEFEVEPTMPFGATYGGFRLAFNLGRLGRRWPDQGLTERVLSLIIHELGHEFCSDHLSAAYYKALTEIGARLALLVARDPGVLDWTRYRPQMAATAA